MTSLFALVDVNAMYCSCEALFHPDLAGRPMVVLSNNDGSIIARNDGAKALGIQMGQPFFEAKPIIDRHQVVYFSSNYTLYGDMATRFVHTLSQFTPHVETYSIDEAFLDLGGFVGVDIPAYARSIKDTVRKWVGLRLVKELRGEPCLDLEIMPSPKQGICTSRSFGKPVSSLSDLSEAVATYASRCAHKLRQQQSNCSVLQVFIHTNYFRENEPQYYNSKTVQLPIPTCSTLELVQYALIALSSIYKEGYHYKKCGVYLSEITPAIGEQISLFDKVDRGKHKSLMYTLDQLNSKLGKGKVSLAAEGLQHSWQPRSENQSPCYTTRITDALKVR